MTCPLWAWKENIPLGIQLLNLSQNTRWTFCYRRSWCQDFPSSEAWRRSQQIKDCQSNKYIHTHWRTYPKRSRHLMASRNQQSEWWERLCLLKWSQGPSSVIFVKKMAQRCGVWQIKRMTSLDQDQVSMKSNMFSFRGYSQMKFCKTYKTA